jgi:hypothetical protein
MTTSHLVAHVRVLWRSERIIAELRLKRILTNLGLQALAAFITACALLSFELAAYFALVQRWDAIWSAVALGCFNLLIAIAVILFALRRPRSRELELANEINQQALTAFEADLQRAENEAPTSVRSALESAAIPALLPLIPLVIERLRKRRTEGTANGGEREPSA